jgi:signal transduction histidine kinase
VSLVYKITVPVFLVLVSIIFLVAIQMRRSLEEPLLREEFARRHEAVLRQARRQLDSEAFSKPLAALSQQRFADLLEQIQSPSTARLTLWSKDRIILFSDLKSVIGARSPDHPDLKRLFGEEKAFYIRKQQDANVPLQSDVGEFLDIYIPLRVSGTLLGAVEIHSVVSALLAPIEKQVRYTTTILAVTALLILGVVYYLAKNLKDERDRQAALAVRNARLYEQSKTQAEELKRANQAKSEFLSVMSHELRTPLNVVMGYAGMIKDRMLGEVNSDQHRALEKVISRAGEQLSMINGILMATQMESGDVRVAKMALPLPIFLDDLRSGYFMPLKNGVELAWKYPPDLPAIQTDKEKLKQILQNLINNAIKFTENGRVTVTVVVRDSSFVARRSSDEIPDPRYDIRNTNDEIRAARHVEFRVADTGIGIAKELQPLIFDMFRQVDSSETRAYGGVGLGLYIVKKLTEALGGRVELESEPGKGSVFTVKLPCEI